MNNPDDIGLPFFAYGLFQPGQICFSRLRPFLAGPPRDTEIPGMLKVRDGIPLLMLSRSLTVRGSLLDFRPGEGESAYAQIIDVEPDKHYRWERVDVQGQPANVLVGVSPEAGSYTYGEGSGEKGPWDGWCDPYFIEALEVVKEIVGASEFRWDLKSLFLAQMAYLLLWSSVERYTTLRFGFHLDPVARNNCLAEEGAFKKALGEQVVVKPGHRPREVRRADRPKHKVLLAPDRPRKAIEYYYQVRSNANAPREGGPP